MTDDKHTKQTWAQRVLRYVGSDEVQRSLLGMVNAAGGTFEFGRQDGTFEEQGVPLDDKAKEIITNAIGDIFREFHPPVLVDFVSLCVFEPTAADPKRFRMLLVVPKGTAPVYYLSIKSSKLTTFVRRGVSTVSLTSRELQQRISSSFRVDAMAAACLDARAIDRVCMFMYSFDFEVSKQKNFTDLVTFLSLHEKLIADGRYGVSLAHPLRDLMMTHILRFTRHLHPLEDSKGWIAVCRIVKNLARSLQNVFADGATEADDAAFAEIFFAIACDGTKYLHSLELLQIGAPSLARMGARCNSRHAVARYEDLTEAVKYHTPDGFDQKRARRYLNLLYTSENNLSVEEQQSAKFSLLLDMEMNIY